MRAPEPLAIYKGLRAHFGFLNWWPGDTPFEVLVGAILTQQTTWTNVERAIANLKAANCLDMKTISKMQLGRLEKIIMPSGYYKQKAKRLKGMCSSILKEHKGLDGLFKSDQDELRKILLSYNGIGKETADAIILYAANMPEFVIDTYTKRIMSRINPNIDASVGYDELKSYFEKRLKRDIGLYKDFHAQLDELGKNYCKKTKPICPKCPIRRLCNFGMNRSK